MSKAEILAELPTLNAEERKHIFERLCELQEEDLLHGVGPTPEETRMLDAALADFRRDGEVGSPWRDVVVRIRSSRVS
ncbi:MAG TPA: hypothetical protein VG269_12215 [Tepidisphaeraceae bacterium]|jgi:hypothetical protein|nr:hypothetical protein [Tepidisphaeraceae bacterium]